LTARLARGIRVAGRRPGASPPTWASPLFSRHLLLPLGQLVGVVGDHGEPVRAEHDVVDLAELAAGSRRMQLIATIEDPGVIQGILTHLGPPGTRDGPPPPFSVTEAGAEQQALPGVTF